MKRSGNFFHEASYLDQEGQFRTSRVPVVQEIARRGIKHLPKRFIRVYPQYDHDLVTSFLADDVSKFLPLISMANLRARFKSKDRAQELAKLAGGARDWGMSIIKDNGVPWSVLQGVRDVVKEFFGLSFEEKKASVGSYVSVDNMGYGRNFVKSEDQPLDWIDRVTPAGATQGLHVWPQRPANFRHAIEQYVAEARAILNDLLDALAEALLLESHAFLQNFDPNKSEINVRVNYYPPCPRPDLALGLTSHSDASALTLFMQFDQGAAGGLQVLKDMKWVSVTWPPEALLVNVGDLLEIMSNGRLKSPWHRVVTQMDIDRFSVALFYNPSPQTEIEPIRDCSLNDEEYKKAVVGDYL
ncbi:hypothetical protein ACE6H2_013851 [Prunus campanulata]